MDDNPVLPLELESFSPPGIDTTILCDELRSYVYLYGIERWRFAAYCGVGDLWLARVLNLGKALKPYEWLGLIGAAKQYCPGTHKAAKVRAARLKASSLGLLK